MAASGASQRAAGESTFPLQRARSGASAAQENGCAMAGEREKSAEQPGQETSSWREPPNQGEAPVRSCPRRRAADGQSCGGMG